MIKRTATCLCGQLSAVCSGEPDRVSVCHCLGCKRRTGSAFSWNASWREAQVRIEGARADFARAGDSGASNVYHFCAACSAIVFYRVGLRPGMVSVPVGAFADPDFPPPRVEVYGERGSGWCRLDIATQE